MQTTRFPPDFADEVSYQAYLKAVSAGQVHINGKNPGELAAELLTASQLAICKRLGVKPEDYLATLRAEAPATHPADFIDEASYQAYLKADAAGLVRIHGKRPNEAAAADSLTPNQQAVCAQLGVKPEDFLATLKPKVAALTGQGVTPPKCMKNGKWVRCDHFLDIEIFRPA